MSGKDYWLIDSPDPLHDAREPRGLHVRLAVDGEQHEAAGLEPEPVEHIRAIESDRGQPEAEVGHDVPDHLRTPHHAL